MGIYGGTGLPFFGLTHIPGMKKPNGDVAKTVFKIHMKTGQEFEYVVTFP